MQTAGNTVSEIDPTMGEWDMVVTAAGCQAWSARVASMCSSKCRVAPPSCEVSARQVKESVLMSVKRQRSCGSSSSLSKTMSSPSGRAMKRRTWPLMGSIQVERQASMVGS